jgi:phosphosulfolactate phosphohydrolase-like enzyme
MGHGLMARRLPGGEAFQYRRSDHSVEIAQLRTRVGDGTVANALTLAVAADLLEAHDETGISLDDWLSARLLVELLIGKPIIENET